MRNATFLCLCAFSLSSMHARSDVMFSKFGPAPPNFRFGWWRFGSNRASRRTPLPRSAKCRRPVQALHQPTETNGQDRPANDTTPHTKTRHYDHGGVLSYPGDVNSRLRASSSWPPFTESLSCIVIWPTSGLWTWQLEENWPKKSNELAWMLDSSTVWCPPSHTDARS